MNHAGFARAVRQTTFFSLLVVVALGGLLEGCASAHPVSGEPVVWPNPPEKPRVQYIRTLLGAQGFEGSFFMRLRDLLFGEDHTFDIKYPTSLALSPDETRLYVSSGPLDRVFEFDLANKEVRRIARADGHSAAGAFGVAVDANDNVYVSDQISKKVLVYSRSDSFLREIGLGLLVRPAGIAVDRARQALYVVDAGTSARPRHVVEVFALDGRHLRTIGKPGAGPGEFLSPSYVTVAPNGNVFVSDTNNSRVQIFDTEGVFVSQFGSLGDGVGQFGKPKGIAFDSFGNIYVVDGQLGWVQIFNSRFQCLMTFSQQAARLEFMLAPNGIAITSKNTIFVADYTGKVNEFQLIDTKAEDSFLPATGAEDKPSSPEPAPAAPPPAANPAAPAP